MNELSVSATAAILYGSVDFEVLDPVVLVIVIVTPMLLGALYVGARAVVRRYL